MWSKIAKKPRCCLSALPPPAGLLCHHDKDCDNNGDGDDDDHKDNTDNDHRNLTIPVMTQKCSSEDEERCEVRTNSHNNYPVPR